MVCRDWGLLEDGVTSGIFISPKPTGRQPRDAYLSIECGDKYARHVTRSPLVLVPGQHPWSGIRSRTREPYGLNGRGMGAALSGLGLSTCFCQTTLRACLGNSMPCHGGTRISQHCTGSAHHSVRHACTLSGPSMLRHPCLLCRCACNHDINTTIYPLCASACCLHRSLSTRTCS